MQSDWRTVTIGDIAEDVAMGPFGSNIPVSCFVPSGIPVISGRHLHETRLFEDTFNFVSVEKADQLRRSNVQRGDIVFTHAGTIGQVSLVPENSKYERYIMSQRQFKLSVRRTEASPKFLVYYFKSDVGQRELFKFANQTGVPSLSRPVTNLRAIPINLPSLSEQEDIANILGLFDDRIDLLHQTNATLESIAQALFKSWFIDFDPVRAKAEGRAPEGMNADMAALFPDSFEDSALGEIPKGWNLVRLSDLLELLYGKALKATERCAGSIPVYGSGGVTGFHDVPLVPHGSVIVGRKGTVGSLYWEDGPFYPIDTTFYVKPKNVPLTYCYYAMQRLGLETMNTDAAVPGLNRDNAYRLELIRPTEQIMRVFDGLVTSLRDSMSSNSTRVKLLSDIRDALLIRLISGKLRLPEAEAQLDEALA
ncbi:restriction endonuclease subunit S [Burkholderia multivorans]|uniref:restriction endonuclease subunit S n=1 Tax=Burkholderia multivorans TaxID=87883 RepID=UPI0009C08966|nr:restriction endonuclease subunit S [Burkholderia multivorans]